MGKIQLQKIVGNLLDKLRKLYMNGTVIFKFLAFLQAIENSKQFYFSEQIFHRKQSLGAPDMMVSWKKSLMRCRRCRSEV